jgi:hypothetical protein
MITGMGGRGGAISSRSTGKQDVSDRASNSDKVIRAIGGPHIATWLDSVFIQETDGGGIAHLAAVPKWEAKGGNSTGTQGTSAKRPTLDAFGINGRAAVKFDASNDCLVWANGGLISTAQAAATVASTSRSSVSGNDSGIIFELGSNNYHSVNGLIQAYSTDGSDVDRRLLIGIGQDGDDSFELSTSERTPNIENVFVSVYDRSTNKDILDGFINSEPITAVGESESANSTGGFAFNNNTANLGARADGGGVPLNGHIREFVLINRKLLPAEAFRLSKALMSKSGITSLLN